MTRNKVFKDTEQADIDLFEIKVHIFISGSSCKVLTHIALVAMNITPTETQFRCCSYVFTTII